MTDNRKRIPIPKDIQPGDVLVLRDGQRKEVYANEKSCVGVNGILPGGFYHSGRSWHTVEHTDWDVVAIERKARKAKPERDDKDAAWLAKLAKEGQTMQTETMQRRLLAIARRLNGGKAVSHA